MLSHKRGGEGGGRDSFLFKNGNVHKGGGGVPPLRACTNRGVAGGREGGGKKGQFYENVRVEWPHFLIEWWESDQE